MTPDTARPARTLVVERLPGGGRRVALLEGTRVVEIDVERDVPSAGLEVSSGGARRSPSLVGAVFKGRVARVVPSMQAAFVDLGLPKAGFLYAGDAAPEPEPSPGDGADGLPVRAEPPPIATLLQAGQELVVQIAKDALGTKGPRITTHPTLPGRYLVYAPTSRGVRLSRRLDPETRLALEEPARQALAALEASVAEAGGGAVGGLIVRTAAEALRDQPPEGRAEELARDLEGLHAGWRALAEAADGVPAPARLHEDLDPVLKSVRDLLGDDGDALVVDDEAEAARIRAFVARVMPGFAGEVRVEVPDPGALGPGALRGVDKALRRALDRIVPLASGGSIVIDRAEALTAIDVNSGRHVGRRSHQETIVAVNLEAADAIAHQLRLRDLGGLVVVDFIDMDAAEDRERVVTAFRAALARDRARTHVLPLSSLGLVEMTRKRVRPSLGNRLTRACPSCDGRARVASPAMVVDELTAALAGRGRGEGGAPPTVRLHPSLMAEATRRLGTAAAWVEDPSLPPDRYRVE